MPSESYDKNETLFDQLFQASGIDPFTHEESFDFFRLITGVEEDQINPKYCSSFEQRFNNSGDQCLFGSPDQSVTSLEVLGTLDFSNAPENSWLMKYHFCGKVFRLDNIENDQFQKLFHQLSGDAKHEFSRDCRHYLESNHMITGADMATWKSSSGILTEHGGDVVGWLPQNSGTLDFKGFTPARSID